MFEILFGWRKASTCKKLIRRTQCRLKLLKNKRDSIVRQLRQDVVQLIKNGHEERAFSRIEQLYKDQSIKAIYDLLDNFCEFVIINLSYIRRHRDCPNDVNEAVSTLLYASARCGDLPELIKLRKLFGERYGQKFATTAVELLHGNLVNCQIIENLCMKSIPDDSKHNLMKEIARDNGLQLDYPEIDGEFELQRRQQSDLSMGDYNVEWIGHELETDIQLTYDGIDGSKLQASYENELHETAKSNNPTSEWKKIAEDSETYSCFDAKNNSTGAIAVVQSAPDIVQISSSNPISRSLVNIENHEQLDPLYEDEMVPERSSSQSNAGRCSSSTLSGAPLQGKVEKITGTASESPSCFSERSIVYLDDVEELQPSTKDVKNKDQRLFMFKSNISSVRKSCAAITISLSSTDQDHIEPCEPSDGKSSSRSASKRTLRKRFKRRCVLVENLSMKDVECALYYGEPDYSSTDDDLFSLRSYPQQKHQRKMTDAESLDSPFTNYRKKIPSPRSLYFYTWRMPEDIRCKEKGKHNISHKCKSNQRNCGDVNFSCDKATDCSLEHPCYFITSDDWKTPYPERKSGSKILKEFPHSNIQEGKCEDLQNLHSSSDEALSTNVNTNRKGFRAATNKQMEEAEVIDCRRSCASSHDSCSRVTSPWTHARPPYLRATTMPPERPKETPTYQVVRSVSCLPKQQSYSNIGSPSYVHPKLPDYDDLATKFRALKKGQLSSSTGEVSNGFGIV